MPRPAARQTIPAPLSPRSSGSTIRTTNVAGPAKIRACSLILTEEFLDNGRGHVATSTAVRMDSSDHLVCAPFRGPGRNRVARGLIPALVQLLDPSRPWPEQFGITCDCSRCNFAAPNSRFATHASRIFAAAVHAAVLVVGPWTKVAARRAPSNSS